MVLPQPDQFPDWAMLDVVDGVSHINNVIAPPLEKQDSGWARQEFPPRQWFNWLGRYTARWIRYLFQEVGNAGTDIAALQAQVNGLRILQTVVIEGTYGVATPAICDVDTPSIVMLYINDTTGGLATDIYTGMFTPRNAAPDRIVNPIFSYMSYISVGDVDHNTGSVIVLNADPSVLPVPTTFQLVAVQYQLGV